MIRRFLTRAWEWYLAEFEKFLSAIIKILEADIDDEQMTPGSVVVICSCGQKNRVHRANFNRWPICGKCRRMLRLPS